MKLKKYEPYKSCTIPRLKSMSKSKPWRCPAKGNIPRRQTSITSK